MTVLLSLEVLRDSIFRHDTGGMSIMWPQGFTEDKADTRDKREFM